MVRGIGAEGVKVGKSEKLDLFLLLHRKKWGSERSQNKHTWSGNENGYMWTREWKGHINNLNLSKKLNISTWINFFVFENSCSLYAPLLSTFQSNKRHTFYSSNKRKTFSFQLLNTKPYYKFPDFGSTDSTARLLDTFQQIEFQLSTIQINKITILNNF